MMKNTGDISQTHRRAHIVNRIKLLPILPRMSRFHFAQPEISLNFKLPVVHTIQKSFPFNVPFFPSVMDGQLFTNTFFFLEALPVQFGFLKGAHFLFFWLQFSLKGCSYHLFFLSLTQQGVVSPLK